MSKRSGPGNDPVLGDSPYPSKKELSRIKRWPYTDLAGLFRYIEERWTYEDLWEVSGKKISCSTGGWSGNEELLAALQRNPMAWALTWQESKRGGHHKFEVRNVHD